MLDLEASIVEQRTAQGAEGCVKTASDLTRYRWLMNRIAPKWVVECGTFSGMSACWFADLGCNVATIDTHPQVSAEIANHPGVTWIKGNSTDREVVDKVRRLVAGATPVMVVLDSDHSAEHVHAELLAYAPLVTVGSYMVVEDGIVRYLPEQLPYYHDSSPLDAIETFLAEDDGTWEVDTELEDMFPTTQNPSGFLRRVG